MSVCAAQRLPRERSKDDWRGEIFGFLNGKFDQMESQGMDKIEDFTDALFQNKSEILGQMALGLIKNRYGDLLEQEYCDCPKCGKRLKAWNKNVKRKVESLGGSFDLYRPYFYCRRCGVGFYPLDEALGLSEAKKQYDIQALETWLSSELPFETASEAFSRCTGETLSADHAFHTANRIANGLDILDICPSKDELEKEIRELGEGKFRRPVIMLAIDGAHAPTRPEPSPWKGKRGKGKYQEAKGFRLYLVDRDRIVHLISWHQIQNDKQLAEALLTIKEADLIPEDKVRLCAIGDGAPWIWKRVREIFPSIKEILDFYHCSEYIHDLANEQYGKGTRNAQEWVEATFARLFHNKVGDVIAGIKRMRPKSNEAEDKIATVVRYLSNHKEKMDYGAARRAGYHIGSGAIESANKFISHVRLKRSGAWWYETNANNILKLRCAKYNKTYEKIMQIYKQSDREQKYAKFGSEKTK